MEHQDEGFWNQIKTLIYGVFIYLKIDTEPVTVLSILMTIDTILGLIKVFRIDPKQFSMRALFFGYLSKLAFLLLPVTIALIGKNLKMDFTIFVVLSLKILTIGEGISIISNMISIKTKEEVKNYDIITKFLKYIRTVFINIGLALLKNKNK